MMRSDSSATIKAFAMVRFMGDTLQPPSITEILRVSPTQEYRLGERYFVNGGKKELQRAHGLWLYDTERKIRSENIQIHINHVDKILTDGDDCFERNRKFSRLHKFIEDQKLKFSVSLFWHGALGSSPPAPNNRLSDIVSKLNGEIYQDFAAEVGGPDASALSSH